MNGNKSLRKKQDNNKKLLGTILDHNNSLLKNMNSPSKPTFLSEPPIGTANKTFTTKFWYPKFQKKKKFLSQQWQLILWKTDYIKTNWCMVIFS